MNKNNYKACNKCEDLSEFTETMCVQSSTNLLVMIWSVNIRNPALPLTIHMTFSNAHQCSAAPASLFRRMMAEKALKLTKSTIFRLCCMVILTVVETASSDFTLNFQLPAGRKKNKPIQALELSKNNAHVIGMRILCMRVYAFSRETVNLALSMI